MIKEKSGVGIEEQEKSVPDERSFCHSERSEESFRGWIGISFDAVKEACRVLFPLAPLKGSRGAGNLEVIKRKARGFSGLSGK